MYKIKKCGSISIKWPKSDKSKWKHGGDTSRAQDAYLLQTPGLILRFLGFKSSSNFGDSCFFLDFGTSYVALFNGLMISDRWILVFHVYCFSYK